MRSDIKSTESVQMIIEVPKDAFEIIRLIAEQFDDEPIEEVTKRMLLTEFEFLLKDRTYLFNMDPGVAVFLQSMQPRFIEILRESNENAL